MGNYTSKLFANQGEADGKSKSQSLNSSGNSEKHQCTPIMTRKCLSADPRSATIGIVRTPIEVDSTTPTGVSKRTASAIPKYLQIKPYLETDIDSVMDTLTPVKIPDPRSPNVPSQRTPIIVKPVPECGNSVVELNETVQTNSPQNSMSDLDPRSPAINFDRTPIMKPKSPGNIAKISHDNVAKCDTESSNVPMLYCETTIDCIIPEVQALPEIVSQKLLSFDERLDACNDTLNDDSFKCGSDNALSAEESDSEGQITVIANVNAPTNYSQPLNVHDTMDELKNEFADMNTHNAINIISKEAVATVENETAGGKIRVWQDLTSPTCLANPKADVFKAPEEIIIEFDDEQSVVKPYNKTDTAAEKMDENRMSNGFPFGKKKKTQPFNRDIKLIYEDGIEYNVNGTVVIDTQKNRTPLGNRSNNHKPGMFTKSPQLLRNKVLSAKSQQQENTPPRMKRGKHKNKSNATQWDLDRTVVI